MHINFELVRDDGTVLLKARLDVRQLGINGCGRPIRPHDVCLERYGTVLYEGEQYLGFHVVPDTMSASDTP